LVQTKQVSSLALIATDAAFSALMDFALVRAYDRIAGQKSPRTPQC
jgi:hypothetical protein